MAKKSFIKGIGNLLGNASDTSEKNGNLTKKAVLKKQVKRTVNKKTAIKSKSQNRQENPESQIKVIRLNNKLTIDQSQTLKENIIEAYKNSRGIKLITDKCDMIDLSIIQLFYSLYQTAINEEKEIEIDIQLNEEQVSLLRNSGIYFKVFTGENNNKILINRSN